MIITQKSAPRKSLIIQLIERKKKKNLLFSTMT